MMWKEAAQITFVCVLAIQMGLIDAVGKLIRYEFRVLSCPKCLTFWVSLGWHLLNRRLVLDAVFASFLSSYAALWLCELYDAMAIAYNYVYEKIHTAAKDQPGPDAVS